MHGQEIMTDDIICPFYGQDEDLCDVGCSYISPSDVRQIIRYCRAQHQDCPKFLELSSRFPEHAPNSTCRPPVKPASVEPVVREEGGSSFGWAAHRDTREQEPEDNIPACGSSGAGIISLAAATANPAPLGLFGFGMTTVLFSLSQTGLIPFDPLILAVGLFYGGLAQIIAGILAWKKNSTFEATAFTSYGLFWLTLVGLMVLPRAGIGELPSTLAMVSYLTLWGMFSTVMVCAALPLGWLTAAVYALLGIFFFGLALAEAAELPGLLRLVGWEGVACGLIAGYTGFAQVVNDVYGRRILLR